MMLQATPRIRGNKAMESEKKMIPGVVYGPHTESHSVWVDFLAFQKVFSEAGENTLIDLQEEGKETSVALIYDVQYDPLRTLPTHIDFFVVDMKEKVEAEVPLEFTGVAPAVKELGGVLVRNMDTIALRCLPADIPKNIIVELDVLKTFDDCVYVKDLVKDDRFEVLIDGESAVALVSPPRKEEEVEAVTTAPEGTEVPTTEATKPETKE